MRRIKRAVRFKRDFKRVSKGGKWSDIENQLEVVIRKLASDQPLPNRNLDHALKGIMSGYRECHIKPDLILIYRKSEDETLKLARLGSHSQLGL